MYHFHRSNTSSVPPLQFYGPSVWWYTDWTSFTRHRLIESINIGLQWRRQEIDEADGAPIANLWTTSHDLFTILQGRQNINPILYHKLFYPMFIQHLKQRHGSQQLVRTLDEMAEQLIA
ncbi:unnamed protein product [Rotaria sp. Silwood1]|nr:unnamed protein product [Rotaria sp. Silwood1]CAF5105373.1 unnamed protein product [Rotaria sp. Silwood1]